LNVLKVRYPSLSHRAERNGGGGKNKIYETKVAGEGVFYVQKNYKRMSSAISIKSNRKHHKTVLYSKSNKNMVGRFFDRNTV
jgi:hypothetical protein